jgi:23S rRNA pseudouridine2457 synthase
MPSGEALQKLRNGLVLGAQKTLPCRAELLDPQPVLPPRNPPVRVRKTVQDWWLSLVLVEGKYHQVRKMTAAVGHPTLRLVRVRIGGWELGSQRAGVWRELGEAERQLVARAPGGRP